MEQEPQIPESARSRVGSIVSRRAARPKASRVVAALLFGVLSIAAVGCSVSTQARGWAAPVQAEDTFLVSTSKGRLDGIDADTREQLWRFPNDWQIPDDKARKFGGFYGAPVLSADGRTVFIGDYNGYIYAFRPGDIREGSEEKPNAASFKVNGPVIGGLVLDTAGNRLYVTAGERVVSVSASAMSERVNARDTNVDFKELYKTSGEIWSTPVLQGSRLFFASLDGNLYAVDKNSGDEAWRYTGARSLVSTPVVSGTTLLVGGFDDRLHAIDMSTGEQRWEFVAANWIWGAPLVDGSRLYVGDFDGTMHAVNLSDGTKIWSLDLSDRPIVASPVLADGVLVVASQDGQLYGIDPSTQSRRWGPTDVYAGITADLVATTDGVLLAPTGCVTPPGETEKRYYITVDPSSGELTASSGVC